MCLDGSSRRRANDTQGEGTKHNCTGVYQIGTVKEDERGTPHWHHWKDLSQSLTILSTHRRRSREKGDVFDWGPLEKTRHDTGKHTSLPYCISFTLTKKMRPKIRQKTWHDLWIRIKVKLRKSDSTRTDTYHRSTWNKPSITSNPGG